MSKVQELTAKTTAETDDIVYLVEDPAGTPLDKKMTVANLVSYETLNTNSDVGSAAGTLCAGNDARLSDARTPASHNNTYHSATYITTSDVTYEALNGNSDVGTGATQVAAGNHTHASYLTTASVITDFISGLTPTIADGTYCILRQAPYAGTITSITTKCSSGTCTLTGKVNTTALGGTANSVSSTEQEQAHATTNTFAAGDDINLVVSSYSACVNMEFTVKFTRALV